MAEEIELKLRLPPGAVKGLLAHPLLQDAKAKRQRFHNVYFDTPDLTLKQEHIALRHRRERQRLLQTVKSGDSVSGSLADRGEWEGPIEPGHFDFSLIDDETIRQRLENARNHLKPVFTTDFSRTAWQLGSGSGTLVELALDRGTIESQGRRARICELELELQEGQVSVLFDLARQLQQTLPLHPSVASKDERGFALWLDQTPQPVKGKLPVLTPDLPPTQAFCIIVLSCLKHLQHNEEGMLSSDHPEHIHQMRVALRRLRSALKLFKPVLPPGFIDRWDSPWRDLGGLLGQARNWDMFATQMLTPLAAAFPGHSEIRLLTRASERQRSAYRKAVRSAITADAYSRLILDFTGELYSPPFVADKDSPLAGNGERKLGDFAVRRLARQAKPTTALARRIQELDAAERHRMRIAFKKLRYAVEFFAPLLSARRLKPYRKELEHLQDALGELNDLAVAQMLTTGVSEVKKDGLAAVWFAARNDLLLRALPEKLDRFLEIKTPWR